MYMSFYVASSQARAAAQAATCGASFFPGLALSGSAVAGNSLWPGTGKSWSYGNTITGCAQRDIQHLIIASPQIVNVDVKCLSAALKAFHANKDSILVGAFWCGQHGAVIDNWYILKIELMQS
ncbi:uncharacterized protein BJ212DRAFT_1305307 [Suillus subaureus]|uniref:Uncharacterized protein n=1 Tax=Suillus subaureus TaxID=48587 RepID=A0A9P7DQI6_9AGAM|nr:uncharacterized protein BJ212DRAFT_1305307 [Suillus subaureus]KAG1800505.1 hypothetical protein BJ212DRAFT_1305307 [Suillus subaureus]